jgi:hypothetical protein
MKQAMQVISLVLLLAGTACAEGASSYLDNLEVRPEIGYGYAAADGKRGMGYNAGIRLMSAVKSITSPEPDKRWGIEVSAVSPFESNAVYSGEKYVAVGLLLEQLLPGHFVATIGTIGYRGYDQARNNPFGLITGLDWEHKDGKKIGVIIGLRYESIYDTSTITRYSLNLAVKFDAF